MNWSGAKNIVHHKVISVMWDRINGGDQVKQKPVGLKFDFESAGDLQLIRNSAILYNGCLTQLATSLIKQSTD
jgi:hypothetical protein